VTTGILSPRRYYLLKRQVADRRGEQALASTWRAKQEATPGTALAANYPARAALVAAGYSTVEDLAGADVAELRSAGLSTADAAAALAARG
jgi:hypothetical protein